jgi:bile acid:Na+ symporter, BASS family
VRLGRRRTSAPGRAPCAAKRGRDLPEHPRGGRIEGERLEAGLGLLQVGLPGRGCARGNRLDGGSSVRAGRSGPSRPIALDVVRQGVRTGEVVIERLRAIENNLTPLVVVAAAAGLFAPSVGVALSSAVTPLLALLMLCVSLTFDLATLRTVLARPGVQALATGLVYGPMSLAGWLIGRIVFGTAPFGLGFALVGALPTDVSSPLLVLIARGNVALATVFNAVNTALAPVLVPALFLAYTGVDLDVPVLPVIGELALTVLVPTSVGVAIRTWRPARVEPAEPVLSATASTAYLLLVVAVVGPNATAILDQPATMLLVAAAALGLNVFGYLLGWAAGPLLADRADRSAMLFTVSKKEFSIAAVIVFASGLPEQVALPAVVYAVVQMLTSPLVARALARRADTP